MGLPGEDAEATCAHLLANAKVRWVDPWWVRRMCCIYIVDDIYDIHTSYDMIYIYIYIHVLCS